MLTNFFHFYCWLQILVHNSVIGVIEQFGLRRYASFSDALTLRWRNKKLVTKMFPLLLLAAKIM